MSEHTFSVYYKREGFPPLQRHWYTALCTWHILGERRATFSAILLLSWVSERHPTRLLPAEGLVPSEEAFVVLSLRFDGTVTFVYSLCWFYSKMHLLSKMYSKISSSLSPSLSPPPPLASRAGVGVGTGGSDFLQLLLPAPHTTTSSAPSCAPPQPGQLPTCPRCCCGAREVSSACPSVFFSIMLVPGLPGRQSQFSSPNLRGGAAAPFLHK